MKIKNSQVLWSGLVSMVALYLASSIKISYIVGSYFAFFSATNSILPLAGIFGGVGAGFLLCVFRIAKLILFNKVGTASLLVHTIPGLGATLYWSSAYTLLMRLVLPVLCILLFIVHPVGWQAMPYTLFWFIPIIIYLIKSEYFFLHALSSTLIAHAIGSVIWVYTMPTNPHMWMNLIPIVFVERIIFALGMMCSYKMSLQVIHAYKLLSKNRLASFSLFSR